MLDNTHLETFHYVVIDRRHGYRLNNVPICRGKSQLGRPIALGSELGTGIQAYHHIGCGLPRQSHFIGVSCATLYNVGGAIGLCYRHPC